MTLNLSILSKRVGCTVLFDKENLVSVDLAFVARNFPSGKAAIVAIHGDWVRVRAVEDTHKPYMFWVHRGELKECPPPKVGKLHGHPRFYELLEEMSTLHSRKNKDYAQGGKPTGNFDRVAQILFLYPDLNLGDPTIVAYMYMLKQLDAVLWSLSKGYDTAVESRHDKMRDIAVYSVLAMVLAEEEEARRKS